MKKDEPIVVVLIGPMGCGKTTIGKVLADQLRWAFYDADDYHPVSNKKKMAEGNPLDDNDREPWLKILNGLIQENLSKEESLVLACSALKEKYRNMLGVDQNNVITVFLKGSYDLLQERISSRSHEFMSKDLLQSQLDTLEEPDAGITVDITGTPKEISKEIIRKLLG